MSCKDKIKQRCLLHVSQNTLPIQLQNLFILYPNAGPNTWGTNNYKVFSEISISVFFMYFLKPFHMPLLWKSLHAIASGAVLGFSSLKMPILIWTLTATWILNLDLALVQDPLRGKVKKFSGESAEAQHLLWQPLPSPVQVKSSKVFLSPHNKDKNSLNSSSEVLIETEAKVGARMR